MFLKIIDKLFFFIVVTFSTAFLFFNLNFATAQIKITNPKGGDTIISGKPVNICWEANNNYPVNLEYSTNQGKNWVNIIENYYGNCFEWIPPASDFENFRFRVKLTESHSPELIKLIKPAHLGEINTVRFSYDYSYFLSSGADSKVFLWDFKSGNTIDSLIFPKVNRVYSAEFFHNPDTILIAYDSTALMWFRKDNNTIKISQFGNIVRSIAVSPQENLFAISSYSGQVKLYQISDEIKEINQFFSEDTVGIYHIKFSPDGQFLHFSDYNGNTIIIKNPYSNNDTFGTFSNGNDRIGDVIWSADISFDSKYISHGGVDDSVRVWDLWNKELINIYDKHKFHVRSVRYHPLDYVCMTGSLDGFIRQWNIFTLENTCEPINNNGQVIALDYSFDGKYLISSGRDSTIKIWRNCYSTIYYDSIDLVLKNQIIAKIPHLISSPNKKIIIPIIIENPVNYKSDQKILTNIKVEIPNRLLHLRNTEFQISKSSTRKDTLEFSAEIFMRGSLDTIKTLVLKGDRHFEEIKLLDFKQLDSLNLIIEKIDGSIKIEEYCIGDFDMEVQFSISSFDFEVHPNPTINNEVEIFMNLIEDGKYTFDLISSEGRYHRIFEREYESGGYYFSMDLSAYTSGIYFLRLISPSEMVSRKLILLK